MKPTSTQIGAIAENLIANALMLESRGRLSPFSPVADDDGIDLLAYDKESGAAAPIQIKSRTLALKKRGSQDRGNVVHFEVRAATFRVDRFAYLIAVLLSGDASGIERAWLVPMRELPEIAARRAKKYVVRASKSLSSNDRFSPYRCTDASELTARLIRLLEESSARRADDAGARRSHRGP